MVVPAFVAGFFSILPTIYTQLTKPRAELTYTIVSGPTMSATDGRRRIFAAVIQNTGKIPLAHVEIALNTQNAKIENMVVVNNLLHPVISLTPPTVTVNRMLPNERAEISVMILSNTTDPTLEVDARSDEAIATLADAGKTRNESKTVLILLGGVLSGFSVALMITATGFFLRRRRRIDLDFARYYIDLDFGRNYKADTITLIAGLSGVVPMREEMLMTKHEVTYARLADIFLFTGIMGSSNDRMKCIAGLKSLLWIFEIAEQSLQRIRDNIEELDGSLDDGEFQKIREQAEKNRDIREVRRSIIDIFRDLAKRSDLQVVGQFEPP